MADIDIKSLSFTYENRTTPSLSDVNLHIKSGEFITLCGKTASGKTTLLRLLKPELSPDGQILGDILVGGGPVGSVPPSKIGFIMQDAESQIVTDRVWHELSFGLENIGTPAEDIRRRVSETALFFGIERLMSREVNTLSGGEKQLVNLASATALSPDVLLLDEPTAGLSPVAEDNFLNILKKINRELGITVIISAHETDKLFPISDKVIVLESGRVESFLPPEETVRHICSGEGPMFFSMPCEARVFSRLGEEKIPRGIADARSALSDFCTKKAPKPIMRGTTCRESDSIVRLSDVCFRYEKKSPEVLKNLSLSVNRGEVFAILGGNGAGKSTLLSLVAGIAEPQYGKIDNRAAGTAFLPQDVTALFLHDILYDELLDGSSKERVDEVLKLCELTHLKDSHIYDMSGGERMRAGIAKLILTDSELLVLDEPTRGLDAEFKLKLGALIRKLVRSGHTVIISSHDLDFCAGFSDRAGMIADGRVIGIGDSAQFFSENVLFTTPAARIARGIIPCAVTDSDILSAFDRKIPEPENLPVQESPSAPPAPLIPKDRPKRLTKKTCLSVAVGVVIMALTVLFGMYFLNDRYYYAVSLIAVVEALATFFVGFTGGKRPARELLLIAVMTAAAVISRAAFFAVPQVKPISAVVILSGAALGPSAGFTVGALSALISNMIFGQGPWTPWQMLALGGIGMASGLIFFGRSSPKLKYAISAFGFLAVFVIYGGIMNLSSLLMWQRNPTVEMILLTYAKGIPFDLIHAGGTLIFLFFTADPVISKLSRITKRR